MTNLRWIAAAVAIAGVVVGAALYIDELETGHTDGGLLDAPRESASVRKASAPAEDRCVGTVPAPPDADPEETPLDRTLARVDKLAAGEHAAVYTGMGVDEDKNAADIWRIPSDAFDTAVCDAAEKGVKLRLHSADVDRRTLDALAERVSEDMNRWDGTFQLREVGVDERGFVHVGVDDPKKAEPLVEKEFGPRYIKVEHVGQIHADAG
ncbi:hypothetical protein [Streptomyces sp. NBC_00140]|uniref:hypothetical protein n=1 Tax=Streptomyces sp. NBC_00140 TaxID=2975664 RepID=UPI00224D6CA1|nr:hypothetical protein [Streptomyces sp. NBC_00140]MCX5332290.1 hypothetical protein [Streptomyces sp. NBC_00140]